MLGTDALSKKRNSNTLFLKEKKQASRKQQINIRLTETRFYSPKSGFTASFSFHFCRVICGKQKPGEELDDDAAILLGGLFSTLRVPRVAPLTSGATADSLAWRTRRGVGAFHCSADGWAERNGTKLIRNISFYCFSTHRCLRLEEYCYGKVIIFSFKKRCFVSKKHVYKQRSR
jgi:hypothetical protein